MRLTARANAWAAAAVELDARAQQDHPARVDLEGAAARGERLARFVLAHAYPATGIFVVAAFAVPVVLDFHWAVGVGVDVLTPEPPGPSADTARSRFCPRPRENVRRV